MFKKTVVLATAVCLAWSSFVATGGVWAGEGKQASGESEGKQASGEEKGEETRAVRMIVGRGDDGWAIVDIRKVTGTLVLVSPMVGREIDLEESNRFAMFHGRNAFNQKIDLRLFNMAVPGFQSAMFLKRSNGKPGVKIRYRSGPRLEDRMVPMGDDNDLRLLREYIEHFEEIQKGEYKIGKVSRIAQDADYPRYTDEEISFEARAPRFWVGRRVPGQLVLKNGDVIRGELVPVYEDGQILIETDLDTRRIAVEEIDRLRTLGDRGTGAMRTAVMSGLGGASSGALMGALAAWQAGGSVKETALYLAAIFGTVSFIVGLMRGSESARGSKEFVLGPLSPGKGKKGEQEEARE